MLAPNVRLVVGIDPGPETSGVVVYDLLAKVLISSDSAMDFETLRSLLDHMPRDQGVVACERTSAGPASGEVVLTTEVVGRIAEMCHVRKLDCTLYYRREVLQALACSGGGSKDSQVRNALIEMHGMVKAAAVGTKKAPGPLYGIATHAWQALGVAVTHSIRG